MTMVFTVKNPALLDKVKPGDSVEFNAERQDGKIILTDIKVAPPTK
jgi:Cu/Ag efflux protein CusF